MGIFDRIKRIVQANMLDDPSADEVMYDSDADLRRIIEELRQPGPQSSQKQTPRPTSRPSLDPALQRAYNTLGCSPSATNDVLKSAYRSRMRDHHPDTVAGASAGEQNRAKARAQDINSAYELIKKHRGLA